MSPQPRGVVPPKHVEALKTAIAARDESQVALDAAVAHLEVAVAAALKAGGSIREVEAVTGLASATVQRYGRKHGWPTAEQQSAREEQRARRDYARRLLSGEVPLPD